MVNVELELIRFQTIRTNFNSIKSAMNSNNRPNRLTQSCTPFKSSHLNNMEIHETKRFIPEGFELGTTLS